MKNKTILENIVIAALSVFCLAGIFVLRGEGRRPPAGILIEENAFAAELTMSEVEDILRERRRFDINTADARTLKTVPGIGPVLAENIIRHRERNGGFSSLSEIREVKGIGPRMLERLEEYIFPLE